MPLFAGIANAEDILVVFLTKNSGDISTIGELDRSVMAGNGLDRDRSALIGCSSRQAAYSGESISGPVSIIRTGMTARLGIERLLV